MSQVISNNLSCSEAREGEMGGKVRGVSDRTDNTSLGVQRKIRN